MAAETDVQGSCDLRFEAVRDCFRSNFQAGQEVGASLAVMVGGEQVVDLWGGWTDAALSRPWQADTLVNVFSTTKVVTALCVLLLADRKQVDVDRPLADYWPEFGRAGKEGVRVRHVLSHTAGLPGFSEKVPIEALYDWERIIHLLEAEKLWWKPGTKLGYHPLTYGYLLGELVRRVTGKTIGTFFRDEIAGPLEIDFHIGLPQSEDGRAAEIVPMQQKIGAPQLLLARLLFPSAMKLAANPVLANEAINTRAWRAAEIPAGNGQGNARSLVRIGAILAGGGCLGGQQVLSRAMVEKAIAVQAQGRDPHAFNRPSAWGLGVLLLNKDLLLGPRSFYATGLGGSVLVMDLEKNVSIAYTMNKMAELSEGDSRSIPLVHAVWECMSN